MKKSLGAMAMSELLKLWPKLCEEVTVQQMEDTLAEGEKPTEPPKNIVTRYEYSENGRVFYANEKSVSRYAVFYIHGGAYRHDFISFHWQFIEQLIKTTNALVIAPGYRLAPFATYKEAFDLIVPLYKQYREEHPNKKVIMMGDSAGGGLSLALAEHFKAEGIPLPDELVLFSPWVDVSMENEEIAEHQQVDPMLAKSSLLVAGRYWAGDLDVHDPRVSPIFGDLGGLRNVTVFVGTDGILYPDARKMFFMLDEDPANELIVGEGMNHVYPLYPIAEAESARSKVFHTVLR